MTFISICYLLKGLLRWVADLKELKKRLVEGSEDLLGPCDVDEVKSWLTRGWFGCSDCKPGRRMFLWWPDHLQALSIRLSDPSLSSLFRRKPWWGYDFFVMVVTFIYNVSLLLIFKLWWPYDFFVMVVTILNMRICSSDWTSV